MVTLTLESNLLNIKLSNPDSVIFNQLVSIMYTHRCRFNKTSKVWVCPYFKYNDIVSDIEDIDIIDNRIDPEDLADLVRGKPEQETEKSRRIPDWSLMNYPPIHGKAPNENFQISLITQGLNRSRYAYLLGMGSGKSYIAAALIAHRLYKYHDCAKVLLLTTNIGVRNLYHELFKFIKGLDPDKVEIADKTNRNPFDHDKDIVVSSYNSFRLICEYYKKQAKITSKLPRKPFLPIDKWAQNKPVMLILDESHEVSHPESQRTRYVMTHAGMFKYRYLFTGSFADKIEKQYSQLWIEDPYIVYNLSYSEWKEKLAYVGDRWSMSAIRGWKMDEVEKQNKRFLQAHGVQYETTELVDLPEYNEKRIYIPMSPQHREVYEETVVQELPSQGSMKDFINLFPYLQLAVDNPFLLEKHLEKFDTKLQKAIQNFKVSYMEKFNALADIIADHPDEKIVVWAIHPKTIEQIGEQFKNLNPICITGSVDQTTRNQLAQDFCQKPEHKLLIANITTMSTSVTLTEAHIQVYFERGYNYTDYFQSTARIYRISQTKDVLSYILIYDRSLDCMVDHNLSSKGLLVANLAKKEFLTQEQWKMIFNASEGDSLDF